MSNSSVGYHGWGGGTWRTKTAIWIRSRYSAGFKRGERERDKEISVQSDRNDEGNMLLL